MKLWEALKALDEDKKIYRPGWTNYLSTIEEVHSETCCDDFEATDWEIVESPVPKWSCQNDFCLE